MKSVVRKIGPSGDFIYLLNEFSDRSISQDQVVLATMYSSIGPVDFLDHLPPNIPDVEIFHCGQSALGIILNKGTEVRGFEIGDWAFYYRPNSSESGGWCEKIVTSTKNLLRMPQNVNPKALALLSSMLLPIDHILLKQRYLNRGDWLLITGAVSDFGILIIQQAKKLGYKIMAVVSGNEEIQKVLTFGADEAIDENSKAVSKTVLGMTNLLGVKMAIDLEGGSVSSECVKSLSVNGKLWVLAFNRNNALGNIDMRKMLFSQICIQGCSPLSLWQSLEISELTEKVNELVGSIEKGQMLSPQCEIVEFSHILKAIKKCEEDHSYFSKLVSFPVNL